MADSKANPNSAYALNLRDASIKHLEQNYFKKSSFRCRRENQRTRRKPAEASMDWKPNAHMAPGLAIEPGPTDVYCWGTTATLPASIAF